MNAISNSPIAFHFVWKEYRTLRGMWIAVVGLGMITQVLSVVFAVPGASVPSIMFGTALGATILYAIGASAVMFSVEHEDETYQFLSGLPARWMPMFTGKLSTAIFSALALAVVLTLTGWAFAGWPSRTAARFPTASDTANLLGVFGVGIFEAIAWGTLFSLLAKRPLVAALWTIVVSAVVVHLAVNYSSTTGVASLEMRYYRDAIALRFAIVAGVLITGAFVARRWLVIDRNLSASIAPGYAGNVFTRFRRTRAIAGDVAMHRARISRPRMLARLLWQTWREAWKMLLLPFVVAALLYAGILGIGGFLVGYEFAGLLAGTTVFLLPTLYGAMAFGSDQRRGSYRFLAEHAARPRFVWLARHLVWLGSLVLLSVVLVAVAAVTFVALWNASIERRLGYDYWPFGPAEAIVLQLHDGASGITLGALLASIGGLTAYGLGQLCSMLMRSEIMAVFLAVVLSVILSAWAIVIAAWNLSAWLFLLPLFFGLMVATWLRAPDWIQGRNSWRGWWKPALAAAAPVVAIGLLLPAMRRIPQAQYESIARTLPSRLGYFQTGDKPAARETAAMYERAANLLHSWDDPLEPWYQYQEIGSNYPNDIAVHNIPVEELDEYDAAVKEQKQLIEKNWRASVDLMIEASRRPNCWFDIDWSSTPFVGERANSNLRDKAWSRLPRNYEQVLELPFKLFSSMPEVLPPEKAVEFHLAAVRMMAHLRQGQPTGVTIRTLAAERQVVDDMLAWAADESVPADSIRKLLDELQQYFQTAPLDPGQPFFADHLIVRGVLEGIAPPLVLSTTPIEPTAYLAYLANELPWERRRALKALDMITMQNFDAADSLMQFLNRGHDFFNPAMHLRSWIRPERGNLSNWPGTWLRQQTAAATSYLTRFEYLARVPANDLFREVVDTETYRRATLLRLALLLYQRDHNKYPDSISELAPDYLADVPHDPYTGSSQPFSFEPAGLALRLNRYANNGSVAVPAGTPLLWSVGPGNVRLKRLEHRSWDQDENDPNAEGIERRDEYYVLHVEDWNTPYFGTPLVFPLP